MKVGDLVRWGCFIGVITEEEFIHATTMEAILWRVHWTDGGVSIMYADEIERVHSYLEANNESR